MKHAISIIITTSGRVEKISRLLESLSQVRGRDQINHEIVIANNATNEAMARGVEALARKFDGMYGVHCWQVREPIAGKCRAQNKTIPLTQGAIVAFLDDDLEVRPEWLESIDAFFKKYPHDVMQGSVIMRPEDEKNQKLQKALYRYRTVDFVNYGSAAGADLKTLTGGNNSIASACLTSAWGPAALAFRRMWNLRRGSSMLECGLAGSPKLPSTMSLIPRD